MPALNRTHNRLSKSHVIADIRYATDYMLCVCGWEGKAYDIPGLRKHQRDSEPYEGEILEKLHTGKFNPSFSSSRVNMTDTKELAGIH